MSRYFRISSAFVGSGSETDSIIVQPPAALIEKLKEGDRLILADWDEHSRQGRCRALGIVSVADRVSGEILVRWRDYRTTFNPNPGGYSQWRKAQGWFQFAKNVAERYRLESLVSRCFIDQADKAL